MVAILNTQSFPFQSHRTIVVQARMMIIVIEVAENAWGSAGVSINWGSKLCWYLHRVVEFGWSNITGF